MDFIYDDGSKDLSLQSLTTTIIIKKILEDEGMVPNGERLGSREAIASKAKEVVNNLPLPSLLKWQLRRMVFPITEEMFRWYCFNCKQSVVVLTQNGILDLQKSIRKLLNMKNLSLMQLFEVACKYCLEQEIFEFGAQINFPHNFGKDEFDTSLMEIWYKIYEGNFHAKLGRKDISKEHYTDGFVESFWENNSAAVKYFLDGDSMSKIDDDILSMIYPNLETNLFTPDLCIKMFKSLKEDKRQRLKSCFIDSLLKALLNWPYQHQFMQAAKSLANNMDSKHFLQVASRIVEKARDGWEDHDYKGLFIDFWKLRSQPKTSYQLAGYARDLLYDVIMMQDKRLANLFLDNTTEEFKTQHLFNFCDDNVCLQLIFEKRFDALELFMKVCKANNNKLIVQFKKDILEYLSHDVPERYLLCRNIAHLNNKIRKNILLEFLSRMEKLKPQMSEISI